MRFNYGLEKKRFEENWERLRKEYREAGMDEESIRKMVLSQGFEIAEDGGMGLPQGKKPSMSIPSDLLPRCPKCGRRKIETSAAWKSAAFSFVVFLCC